MINKNQKHGRFLTIPTALATASFLLAGGFCGYELIDTSGSSCKNRICAYIRYAPNPSQCWGPGQAQCTNTFTTGIATDILGICINGECYGTGSRQWIAKIPSVSMGPKCGY